MEDLLNCHVLLSDLGKNLRKIYNHNKLVTLEYSARDKDYVFCPITYVVHEWRSSGRPEDIEVGALAYLSVHGVDEPLKRRRSCSSNLMQSIYVRKRIPTGECNRLFNVPSIFYRSTSPFHVSY
ncbi:hypothetical protein R1flu_023946 [Riccia fluitans]|uniref:Uncharacterized protein n=1 Tax=Riccia fluitans TaxID=41844 RepID=A0ABD1XTY3_9MARC